MNTTKRYYQDNFQEFYDSTVMADVTPLYEHFVKYLPAKAYILLIRAFTFFRSKISHSSDSNLIFLPIQS